MSGWRMFGVSCFLFIALVDLFFACMATTRGQIEAVCLLAFGATTSIGMASFLIGDKQDEGDKRKGRE